jgi:hypothetical protein
VITVRDDTADIKSINSKVTSIQDQINSLIISPDSTSAISNINDLILTMNESITELQNLIGDGNINTNLTGINDSLTSLQDQINNLINPQFIRTMVYTFKTYYRDMKTFIENTITGLNSLIKSI